MEHIHEVADALSASGTTSQQPKLEEIDPDIYKTQSLLQTIQQADVQLDIEIKGSPRVIVPVDPSDLNAERMEVVWTCISVESTLCTDALDITFIVCLQRWFELCGVQFSGVLEGVALLFNL